MTRRPTKWLAAASFAVIAAGTAACTTTPTPQPVRAVGGILTMSGSGINLGFGATGTTVGVSSQYGKAGPFNANHRAVTVSSPGQGGATDTVTFSGSDAGTLLDALAGGHTIAGSNPDIAVTATVALGSSGQNRTARCSTDPALNFGHPVDMTGFVAVNNVVDATPTLPVTTVTNGTPSRFVATVDLNGTCYLLPDATHATAEPLTSALNVQVYITP